MMFTGLTGTVMTTSTVYQYLSYHVAPVGQVYQFDLSYHVVAVGKVKYEIRPGIHFCTHFYIYP